MALQGKCEKCKKRYVWGKLPDDNHMACLRGEEIPLRETKCAGCGDQLKATVHYSKLPIVQVNPGRVRR